MPSRRKQQAKDTATVIDFAQRGAVHTADDHSTAVTIGLNAAIVAVSDEVPQVTVVRRPGERSSGDADAPDDSDGLPFGPFEPAQHRTLELGLRTWVDEQTGLTLGYTEQLYTFGDRGRHAADGDHSPQVVSIGYLALTDETDLASGTDTVWQPWYQYFPWEDWRSGEPDLIRSVIHPLLKKWSKEAPDRAGQRQRWDRACQCFGFETSRWDEEKVLERYELLYEAGLVFEAQRDRPHLHADKIDMVRPPLGAPMIHDHRRILATAMGRLRGKLKYRPVVFELMPAAFTLLELQRTVEAISGVRIHKQNFRRLLEKGGLVESTGEVSTKTGGRPAALFRFRREVLRERPAPGVKLPSRGPRIKSP